MIKNAIDMLERLEELSSCRNRKVGSFIVDPMGHIISTGWNGNQKCVDKGCLRKESEPGKELNKCRGVHAEVKALFPLGWRARGCTLYSSYYPCSHCASLIGYCNIFEVIYLNPYEGKELSELILLESGVKIRRLLK